MIVDPWGMVLAQARDEECFVAADLDLGAQERIRDRAAVAGQPPPGRLPLARGG